MLKLPVIYEKFVNLIAGDDAPEQYSQFARALRETRQAAALWLSSVPDLRGAQLPCSPVE